MSSQPPCPPQIPSRHTRDSRRLQPRKLDKTARVKKKTRPVRRWIERLHRAMLLRLVGLPVEPRHHLN
jgi:hypothetical protein